jgi:hypothetical protein
MMQLLSSLPSSAYLGLFSAVVGLAACIIWLVVRDSF